MDAQDFRSLQEAYLEVYNDLDEGASEDVAARSEKLAKQRKGQTPQRKAMYQGLALKARIRASGGNPGDKSQGHPLRRASNRPIHPHDSKYGRSGLTQSKRDERRDIDAATHGEYSDGPGTVTKNPKKLRKQKALGELGEQADLYDIILSHLLDEGYAETVEAAEVMMVNMSEEWRESIVEASGEWFRGIFNPNNSVASKAQNKSPFATQQRPLPSGTSPFAKPASRGDSGKLTTYGAGGGAAAERASQTRTQVMQQGAKNLENKKSKPVNQGPDFGR